MPLAEFLRTTKSPVLGEDKKTITGDVIIMEFMFDPDDPNRLFPPAPTIALTDTDAARWLQDVFSGFGQGTLSGVVRLTPDGSGHLYDRTTDGKIQPMVTVLLDDADVMPLDSMLPYLLPHAWDPDRGE